MEHVNFCGILWYIHLYSILYKIHIILRTKMYPTIIKLRNPAKSAPS